MSSKNIQIRHKNGSEWDNLYPKTKAELVEGLDEQLAGKVDKEEGKGLSTEDYTTEEKNKLAGIEEGANKYVHPTSAGNKHIPSGGAPNQVLKYGGSSGTATWGALTSADIPTLALSKISDAGTAASRDIGTSAGNVPVLDSNGKLDVNVLPAIAISDTFVVGSEGEMLGLTAEVGDIAVRSDINKTFILRAEPASVVGNWQELLIPTSPVQSVAGKTGAVTLVKGDVGLGNVQNYGIATQEEAEAGTSDTAYMTPLKTAQAIAALAPAPDASEVSLSSPNFTSTNVRDGMDELFQSVSDGKNQIASAITDMGQSASGGDTFAQLSSKIRDISKDANAAVGDVLTGKTFYQGGVKRTGTMPNNGSVSQTLTSQGEEYTIPEGYHDGTGTVTTDIVNLSAGNIRAGATVGGVDGTFTSDATATAGQILSGRTAYVNGSKVTGSMTNNGAVSKTLTTQGASYTIPSGYHNGSGTVTANITNLTAANIKAGTTVGGVEGTFTSDATATAGQILSGRTAYVNGSKVTGTMPVKTNDYGAPRTGQTGRLYVTPEAGYHDGTVRVYTDDANFNAANIKSGVTLFGITGTYAPISVGSTTLTFNRSGSGNNVTSIIYYANYTPPKTNFLGSFQIPVTFTIGNIEYKGDPFNSITIGYPTNLIFGYGLYIVDPTVNAEIQISAIYNSSTGRIQLQIGNPSTASPKALFTNISTNSFTTGLRYVSWE
jgi:hypothetical protein